VDRVIKNPVKVIRAHCIDCSGGSPTEADNCSCVNCNLWPWRKGKNPYRKEMTEEQKVALRERALARGFGQSTQNAQLSPQT